MQQVYFEQQPPVLSPILFLIENADIIVLIDLSTFIIDSPTVFVTKDLVASRQSLCKYANNEGLISL